MNRLNLILILFEHTSYNTEQVFFPIQKQICQDLFMLTPFHNCHVAQFKNMYHLAVINFQVILLKLNDLVIEHVIVGYCKSILVS